jgi:hypothetical protein
MPEPRLFLDADGVLADFDEGARRLLGMSVHDYERKHGRGGFWWLLAQAEALRMRNLVQLAEDCLGLPETV